MLYNKYTGLMKYPVRERKTVLIMKKMSTLTMLILAFCAFCLILMRTCGSSEQPPKPTYTPAPVTEQPAEPAVSETPTPVIPLTTPEPKEMTAWTTDGVNLRRSADMKGEIITVIPKDEQIQRLDYPSGGWVQVKYGEFTGFISNDYIGYVNPASASAEPVPGTAAAPQEETFSVTPCNDIVYTTDGVNLRRGPGTDYELVGSVNKDTALQRTGTTDNGWSRVIYNSVGYFVSSDFVTTNSPAAAAQTEPANTSSAALGGEAASGEFKSDTGVPLNVIVRWTATPNADGSYELAVSAVLSSSALTAAQYADNLCFRIAGNEYYKTAPAISLTGNETVETPLGSQSVKVSAGAVPVSVTWTFKGSYSGKDIDKITAETTLRLK